MIKLNTFTVTASGAPADGAQPGPLPQNREPDDNPNGTDEFASYAYKLFEDTLQRDSAYRLRFLENKRRVLEAYSSSLTPQDTPTQSRGQNPIDRQRVNQARTINHFKKTLKVKHGNLVQINPTPSIAPIANTTEAREKAEKTRKMLRYLFREIDLDSFIYRTTKHLSQMGNCYVYAYNDLDAGPIVPRIVKEKATVVIRESERECPSCGSIAPSFRPEVMDCQNCGGRYETVPPLVEEVEIERQVRCPRGEVRLDICSVFETVTPLDLTTPEEMYRYGWIARARLLPIEVVREAFPEYRDRICSYSSDTAARHTVEFVRTINVQIPDLSDENSIGLGRATTDDGRALLLEIWLSPTYVKEFIRRGLLTSDYSRGAYLAYNGSLCLTKRPESMEDHWTFYRYDEVIGTWWADSDADDLLRLQGVLNHLFSLIFVSVLFRSVGWVFVNQRNIDPDKLANDPSIVRAMTNIPSGQPLSNAIHVVQGHGLDAAVYNFYSHVIQTFPDLGLNFPNTDVKDIVGPTAYAAAALRQQMMQSLRPFTILYFSAFKKMCEQMLGLAYENWKDDEPRIFHEMLNGVPSEAESISREDVLAPHEFQLFIEPNILAPQGPYDLKELVGDALRNGLINLQDPKSALLLSSLYGIEPFYQSLRDEEKKVTRAIDMAVIGRLDEVPVSDANDIHDVWVSVLSDFFRSERGQRLQKENPEAYAALAAREEVHLSLAAKNYMEAAKQWARALGWNAFTQVADEQENPPKDQPQPSPFDFLLKLREVMSASMSHMNIRGFGANANESMGRSFMRSQNSQNQNTATPPQPGGMTY